jgi:hypothetical protein
LQRFLRNWSISRACCEVSGQLVTQSTRYSGSAAFKLCIGCEE